MQTCGDQLPKCVDSVDNILKEFDQPEFYRTPKFHASILWCLPLSNESEENTNIQNSKHLDLETELQGFIKDINEEFRAAIKTGEVSRVHLFLFEIVKVWYNVHKGGYIIFKKLYASNIYID